MLVISGVLITCNGVEGEIENVVITTEEESITLVAIKGFLKKAYNKDDVELESLKISFQNRTFECGHLKGSFRNIPVITA